MNEHWRRSSSAATHGPSIAWLLSAPPVFAVLIAGCGGARVEQAVGSAEETLDPEAVFAAIGPADLATSDADTIREAAAGSAPRAYFVGLLPLTLLEDGALTTAECPRREVSGNARRFIGGCDGGRDTHWLGEATITRPNPDSRLGTVTLRGFGYERQVRCPDGQTRLSKWVNDGTFEAVGREDDHRFRISMTYRGEGVDRDCRPFRGPGAFAYEGRAVARGQGAIWSGEGRFGWKGFGWVRAWTEGERIDRSPESSCQTEALEGRTVLESGGATVELRYDGASSCDAEGEVAWARDGVTQPRPLAGVHCDVGGTTPSGPFAPVVLI